MVHRSNDEGHDQPNQERRKRGRPFTKGHTINTKPKNKVLDDSGRESGDSRGVVAPDPRSSIVEQKKEEIQPLATSKGTAGTIIQPETTVSLSGTTVYPSSETPKEESKDPKEADVLVDTIDFMNGDNKLSIRFTKKHNRMFRIQVFLNDENEIRPVTYTGASTGNAFWNLLKGAMKK